MKNNLTDITLHVEGMSCSACELRIESKVKALPGVQKVAASNFRGTVYVEYDEDATKPEDIRKAIEDAGYTVAKRKTAPAQSPTETKPKQKSSIGQILGILIVVFALYLLVSKTVGFNFIPNINQNMGYGILFVVGLITSIHCLAMCGGINLSQNIGAPTAKTQGVKGKILPGLLYNAGRILSYTLIGGIVGAIGSVISFSGPMKGVVAILSGVFMLVMGLNMLGIAPWLAKFNIRMPKKLGSKIYASRTSRRPFFVGLLNGLMPCGPLQAMQLYALGTGSFFAGAFSMLMFSLGTVPLMFLFGAISTLLSSKFTHNMMRVSAALVIVLGFVMMGRGFSLSGIQVGTVSAAAANPKNAATVTNGVQEVTTALSSGQYAPITVQKGVPVKWTIQATSKDLNGCNNTMVIPKYNIEKKLVPGDNVIEFTPTDSGTIPYSCWMGMIRSTISVVDDVNNFDPNAKLPVIPGAALPAGGCCGAQPNSK